MNTPNFEMGYPDTVFDWVAYRDIYRERLDTLDVEIVAMLYGLSTLVAFRDDDCLRRIEHLLDTAPNPVLARYVIGCELAEQFGGEYWRWTRVYTPEEIEQRRAIENGAYGPYPIGRPITPEDPGYVGPIPLELRKTVTDWIVAGIPLVRDDEELFFSVRNIAARFDGGDTFLEAEDIERLRQASGDPLTMATNLRGQQIIRAMIEKLREFQEGNPGQDPSTQSPA